MFDLPFFSLTINNQPKPNYSNYLYNYLSKESNDIQYSIIIVTLFDELLKITNFDFSKNTIQLPKLNQKTIDILSSKYKITETILSKPIHKNKLTNKNELVKKIIVKKNFHFILIKQF